MRVLAIAAHPDDIEISCAGTLARYKKMGWDVFMCHVSNGNQGHAVIMPDELRAIRRKEFLNSAALLGAEGLTCDIDDLCIYGDMREHREKVMDIIRYARPDVIITHSPNDYMPDHVAVSKLVFDASFVSTLPHYTTRETYYETLTPIYYMDTLAGLNFIPTEYVDITDTYDQKMEMLRQHESQLTWMKDHDGIDFAEFVSTCARYRGLQCGAGYAEAFTPCYAWPKVKAERYLP
ncbi:PIG-L family deacetylase [Lactonifactor longoviformis]|uniref:N-acetylglucosaminyl deacetylase, LmbE family n=1 Tax=Lactonifactor longoviformis DSM 17459 TaxID=1122155 RepID=A0A1M4XTP1_9CLOT|nr:PIG-L deacetylase family protein [Lactonifactor longoviformis]POP32326.1 PIG-L family deacetylase [Lactonifactor longoviformis]SHE96815.1 N-acetylglucosaminyl deacetylase, LmbE family [Lactonifactor longoviformis DSM 17459]